MSNVNHFNYTSIISFDELKATLNTKQAAPIKKWLESKEIKVFFDTKGKPIVKRADLERKLGQFVTITNGEKRNKATPKMRNMENG